MTVDDIPIEAAILGLNLLVGRFPESGPVLRHLFQESPSFQTLCFDYQECLVALQKWQQSTATEAAVWRQEYAQLLQELEQEVRRYLEDQLSL